MAKLSVIVPVFNERNTLEEVVRRVRAVDYGCALELVLVDDCSTDGSRELVENSRRHTRT
jgi:glycosyltransferase involved in cell wall biosynthesis